VSTQKFKKIALPYETHEQVKPLDKIIPLHEYSLDYILRALKTHNWCRTKAAKSLGVGVRTIRSWISDLKVIGFEIPEIKEPDKALMRENAALKKKIEMLKERIKK
jgi:DNA-binding NtrC family response regulator